MSQPFLELEQADFRLHLGGSNGVTEGVGGNAPDKTGPFTVRAQQVSSPPILEWFFSPIQIKMTKVGGWEHRDPGSSGANALLLSLNFSSRLTFGLDRLLDQDSREREISRR